MKEANVQEAFYHLKGYAEGLNMMLAYTINMVTDAEGGRFCLRFLTISLRTRFSCSPKGISGVSPGIDGNPVYEGFRECIETMKTQLIRFRTIDAT